MLNFFKPVAAKAPSSNQVLLHFPLDLRQTSSRTSQNGTHAGASAASYHIGVILCS